MKRIGLTPLLACLFVVSAEAAVPVSVAPLASQLIDQEVRAPATVVAANRTTITAQLSGIVEEVLADVGAQVAAGDLLARIDDRDARLALAQARADLAATDAEIAQALERVRHGEELFAKNFIADDELLLRRTTLAVLEAGRRARAVAVESAELNLSRTRILAPFPAAVVARQAQQGGLAQPGTALFTLVQTDNREVEAEVDPRYATELAAASDLRFESQGRRWPVSLARLSPVVEADSRIQLGRFRFTETAARIGVSGEVVWRDAAGLIPVPLVIRRDGRLGIFVADGAMARFVALPEAQEGRPVRASLPPDTQVVVRGQARLQDGDALNVSRP